MSGIYIPGMKMPENCGKCPACWEQCGVDKEAVEEGYRTDRERHPDCPLVHVPDHGRLIDADAIPYNKIMLEDDEFYYGVTKPYIDRMPTIIETEGDL